MEELAQLVHGQKSKVRILVMQIMLPVPAQAQGNYSACRAIIQGLLKYVNVSAAIASKSTDSTHDMHALLHKQDIRGLKLQVPTCGLHIRHHSHMTWSSQYVSSPVIKSPVPHVKYLSFW
jgi:hypothetical protein